MKVEKQKISVQTSEFVTTAVETCQLKWQNVDPEDYSAYSQGADKTDKRKEVVGVSITFAESMDLKNTRDERQ